MASIMATRINKENSMFILCILCFAVTVGRANDASIDNGYFDFEVDLDRMLDVKTIHADQSNNDPNTIDVAAFNVRIFGKTKMSDPFVVDKLTKIILRYDLILIQEIRDSTQTAIQNLLQEVNSKSGSLKYSMEISARLGRTTSKEQYGYMYRSDVFSVVDHYVYDDSANDIFQREPFVVKFSSSIAAISSFIAIGIHTAPSDATTEIDHLVDVYDDAVTRMKTSNAIIMGDFNAGCSYVSNWPSIRLATDSRFYWLINDITDTTSSGTECAYDRLVVAGTEMIDAILPLSPSAFYFDKEFKLTSDEALRVSDHYPVQVKIRTKQENERISLKRLIKVDDNRINTSVLSQPTNILGYTVIDQYNAAGSLLSFTLQCQKSNLHDSIKNLQKLQTDLSNFISNVQVNSAKRQIHELSMIQFLPKNNGVYKTLKDYYKNIPMLYTTMANCEISKKKCSLIVEISNGL